MSPSKKNMIDERMKQILEIEKDLEISFIQLIEVFKKIRYMDYKQEILNTLKPEDLSDLIDLFEDFDELELECIIEEKDSLENKEQFLEWLQKDSPIYWRNLLDEER